MTQFDVNIGDRIRYETNKHPGKVLIGILKLIIPAPDGNGELYLIEEPGQRPQDLTVRVSYSPDILSMDRLAQG